METYRIGIDIGGTAVKTGAVDSTGRILSKGSIETGAKRSYAEVIRDIAAAAKKAAMDAGLAWNKISGAGAGMPGSIDPVTGEVEYSNNIAWKNVPLGAELSKLLKLPVKVDNDANAAAIGEYRFGAGRNYQSSILFTLGTGIGAGIIIDGKLFAGYKSAHGELGHIVIVSGGRQCTCGRRGCFEAYASATGLINLCADAIKKYPDSVLAKKAALKGGPGGKTAFEAAREGDPAGKKVVADYIEYLAEGITNCVNAFHPQAVLIGGGVSAEGEFLLAPLRASCLAKVYGGAEHFKFDIIAAQLGNDAGLLGAAFL